MRKKERLLEVLRDVQRRAENILSGQQLFLVEFGMEGAVVKISHDRGAKSNPQYKLYYVEIDGNGDFVKKPDPLVRNVAYTLLALWLYDQL